MKIEDFKFDENVARIFDDMLNRSIPLYAETQSMALRLAFNFIRKKSCVYDIGCSTGTVLKSLAQMIPDSTVKLIGLDNSKPMLDEARKKLQLVKPKARVELLFKDITRELEVKNASVIIMNYTLQFVRPLYRELVVRQLFEGMNKNGCLIMIEKVLGNNSLFNRMYIELYYAYKRERGYSDKEINQKREALENVLIPYRIDENFDLLKKCGFQTVDLFFKWYNFAGIIAIK
tara:strand:- start:356 stop:1051 length:696 start_codon:yes stop_codon:yes gene_type:complete